MTADLLARVEAAEAGEQRALLSEAFGELFPEPSADWRSNYAEEREAWNSWSMRRSAFRRMLDASAFESAAMMLVPEGRKVMLGEELKDVRWRATLSHYDAGDLVWRHPFAFAPTPALALTAACLRAIRTKENGDG